MNGFSIAHVPRSILGYFRCSYQLGLYERAMEYGKNALYFNRHQAGVHKLMAMPLSVVPKVLRQTIAGTGTSGTDHGDLDPIHTMFRSLIYEAPWDEGNRTANMEFLDELIADREGASAPGLCKG